LSTLKKPDVENTAPVFGQSSGTSPQQSGPQLAGAQQTETQQQADASSDELGEVTVTATRRNDTVNRVPLSITALTGKSLDTQSINTVG
jgi:outer membrane receptor protein involved in Fe transport